MFKYDCERCNDFKKKLDRQELKGLASELVKAYDEYIAFLGKSAVFSALHSGCSAEEFQEGERLRGEIKKLKDKLPEVENESL